MTKFRKDITGHSALSRRRIIKGAGAIAAGLAAPAILGTRSAFAAFPDRAVKVVVANTPGGPSDIVGRMVSAALQQSTGKTFIIDRSIKQAVATLAPVTFILSPLLTGGKMFEA